MNAASGPNGAIRAMAEADVDAVVAIHLRSFPSFFLTFLGKSFLRLLYSAMAGDSEGVVLVYEQGHAVRGFVAGVLRQSGFYRRLLKRRKWAFAWSAVGAVLRRPAIVPRLWRALKRPEESGRSAADACLMSLAVLPEMEHGGIGRQLVEAFCGELTRRRAPNVCLTTDQLDNERVNRFYSKLGFRIARTFITPEGRAMNEYLRQLS